MTDRVFVDTNVLLYRFSDATPGKRDAANAWMDALWAADAGCISWQVLLEFYPNATRKSGVAARIARQAIRDLLPWNPISPTDEIIEHAWRWCDAAQLNFWDALILAAAEQSNCPYLLSEDFQAGRRYGKVTVVNPFERQPSEFPSLTPR